METVLVPADAGSIRKAAELLLADEVVAIPTETVYGLAASALSSRAVRRIFEAKGRPQDNPLIVHIADMEMLPLVSAEATQCVRLLAAHFWPGPLTLVLPLAGGLAAEVSGGLTTVGVRMPAHPVARAVIRAAGVPLAAPSANLSGSPSPTTAAHVLQDMDGRIPMILDGGACDVGVESTVLSLISKPVILRPGLITAQQISDVLNEPVEIATAVVQPLQQGEKAVSPGMKYKHYAPKARLTLIKGSKEAFAAFVEKQAAPGVFALVFEEEAAGLAVPALTYGLYNNPESQAAALFGALRRLDEKGAVEVYVHAPGAEGVGLAVYNRLLRAACFRIKEV